MRRIGEFISPNVGEPAGTLEMGAQLPNLEVISAHHTVRRKLNSGMKTAGMTFCGLHDSQEAAEAARLKHGEEANPWRVVRGGITVNEFTQGEADVRNQEWMQTTEVVFLKKDDNYRPHGSGEDSKIHGVDDGAIHK